MDASLIIVALVALALGALIGWLLGIQRGQSEGKAVAESLRMQLDGVVKERDEARDRDRTAERRAGRGFEPSPSISTSG